MDHIDTTLTNVRLNERLDPAIRKSIGLAKKTLNRYYAQLDLSATDHISHCTFSIVFVSHGSPHANHLFSVLDPRYKLRYYEVAR